MVIQVMGKQSFFSSKKNKDFYILHSCFRKEEVEGFAVEQKFVSEDIFNNVEVGKNYSVVYDAYSNGRAFISQLVETK